VEIDETERRRRFVIQSLLTLPGLELADYAQAFNGADPCQDTPLLGELLEAGLAQVTAARIELTQEGLALSDSIGPALISAPVWARMQAFEVI
jgi:oxygen-independent coproporphyrinogen-3 oxidase